jgi:hypothetical protein
MRKHFQKSSYSVGENNCVEVGGQPIFTKSSYCANATCVEVASPEADAVLVIDSKQPEAGRAMLAVTPGAFSAFVDSLKG